MPSPTEKPIVEPSVRKLAQSFGFQPVSTDEKQARVSGVFDNVAEHYDIMNDVMSAGVHRLWKESLLDWLAPRPGIRHIDVAGGTGDVAIRLLNRVKGQGDVTAIDINPAMLSVGRDKALDDGMIDGLSWVAGDAQALPVDDRAFHSYTIAFGIRNVPRIDLALREAHRCLRPGGRFLCLEFSELKLGVLQLLYDAYSFKVVPEMGKWVAGDAESYRYLVESIRQFPNQETFSGIIRDAGFSKVSWRNLSGGIAAIHSGWRL